MTVDKVRRAAEQFVEGRELYLQLGLDDFGVEPPQQAGTQELRKGQEQAAVERLEMHRQGPKRRRQRDVQADGATGAVGGEGLKRAYFIAAAGWSDHHHRRGIETA